MSKKYGKLVRDNIPEIIKAAGKTPKTRLLNDDEYLKELIAKLKEEVQEFAETPNIEEMADIQEVLESLRESMSINIDELSDVKSAKASKNGAFKKRIYLESVD